MAFFYFVAQRHEAVWICSGLIAFTAVYFAWKYRRGVAAVRRQVLALIRICEELPPEATQGEILRAVDESPIGGKPLATAFNAWSRTFVKNYGEDGPRYYSTTLPGDGLDAEGFACGTINFRLIHSVPNILIGMGLLFTFLGLTAALMFAAQGAMAQDVAVAQTSLNGLLGAATFKFITSLVGLAFSLAFGFFEKWQHKSLSATFQQLSDVLQARFPYVSPQQILDYAQRTSTIKKTARVSMLESLEVLNSSFDNPVGLALIRQDIARTREEAEEQTALLKTFSTDLAASIARTINETLTPQLTSTFERLQERIDSIGQHLNATNTDALKSIVSTFSREFQAQAQSSFDEMLTAVGLLTDSIGEHSTRFALSFEGVQEVVTALREEGRSGLSHVQAMIVNFATTVTRLEGLTELLQTAAEPLSRVSESAAIVMQSVQQTQAAASEMVQQLESVSSGFKGIDADLTQAFTAMHSGFERIADDLRRFVTDLDASFSKALGGVHEVTGALEGGVQDLSGTVEVFTAGLEKIQETVQQLRMMAENQRPVDILSNGPIATPALAE
jgi:ABC-type transporter Mla subunit MlaD